MSNFIAHTKRLNAKKIIADKHQRIREALWNYNTTIKILPIILTFTGKKISKHIVNKINKELPELKCYLDTRYGMYHINVPTPEGFSTNYSLLIGYDTEPIISEKVNKHAQCYILEQGRAERISKGLIHIERMCEEFNICLDKINIINKEAEKYEMEYDFDLGSKYLK